VELKAGMKLHSAVCDAQVVVVRAPDGPMNLECGGAPLLADGEEGSGAVIDPAHAAGVLIGKRYTLDGTNVELLCTKAGEGSLSVDGVPMTIKGAKPLPASD
jgi:hypothetical protein